MGWPIKLLAEIFKWTETVGDKHRWISGSSELEVLADLRDTWNKMQPELS